MLMYHITHTRCCFMLKARDADDAPLALAYPPWAYQGKGRGKAKGGCGGQMVDAYQGEYIVGGYRSPDGDAYG